MSAILRHQKPADDTIPREHDETPGESLTALFWIVCALLLLSGIAGLVLTSPIEGVG